MVMSPRLVSMWFVNGIDDAPNAVGESYNVNAGTDTPLAIKQLYYGYLVNTSLLKNDKDPEFGAVTISSVEGQALVDGSITVTGSDGGEFTITTDGLLNFDAGSGFEYLKTGESVDTIVTYGVTDPNGNTSYATVTVTVDGLEGDAVLAAPDTFTTDQNTVADIALADVLGSDWSFDDAHTMQSINGLPVPSGSSASYQGSNGGEFTSDGAGNLSFDPGSDFDFLKQGETAITSVTYTTQASNGESATSTVNVVVTGVNDAPCFDEVKPII